MYTYEKLYREIEIDGGVISSVISEEDCHALIGRRVTYVYPSWEGNVTTPNTTISGICARVISRREVHKCDSWMFYSRLLHEMDGTPVRFLGIAICEDGTRVPIEHL